MNKTPLSLPDQKAVARLQDEIDELRRRLGISERGCVLYRADANYADEEVVIVEADGFGGAILMLVEGNYPVDYFTYEERAFSTESEAVETAESLVQTSVS